MTTLSRRAALTRYRVSGTVHPGLWLDKYMDDSESSSNNDPKPKQRLVEQTAGIQEPAGYKDFFEQRWKPALEAFGAVSKSAEVVGRLAVGLGDESVIETAITLHRTYGMPLIPGSALKGLAASYARNHLNDPAWQKSDGLAYLTMFGNTDEAGFVTFFDALYIPGSGANKQALHPDVITPHHQTYNGDGSAAPTDWDDPNPVPFLSATGSYLIALAGPEKDWVKAGFTILEMALSELGVGAKTSSGYGRMRFEGATDATDNQMKDEVDEQPTIVNQYTQKLAAMPIHKVASEIPDVVNTLSDLDIDETHQKEIARAILAKIREANREKKSRDKKWFKKLIAIIPEEVEA